MPDLRDGESVEMKRSGSKPYVLKNTGGVYSCSCPAWRNQSLGIEARTCKHLRKLRGDAAEEARIGRLAGTSQSEGRWRRKQGAALTPGGKLGQHQRPERLSLRSGLVLCGQYQAPYEARQKSAITGPTSRPADWQNGDPKWNGLYNHLLGKLEPAKPKESAVMKTLVDDFIARGQEISAGQQTSLSDYWR